MKMTSYLEYLGYLLFSLTFHGCTKLLLNIFLGRKYPTLVAAVLSSCNFSFQDTLLFPHPRMKFVICCCKQLLALTNLHTCEKELIKDKRSVLKT